MDRRRSVAACAMRGLATGLGVPRSASVQLHLARLVTIVTATTLGLGISVLVSIRPGDAADTKFIDATSFRCVTSLSRAGDFCVDHLRGGLVAAVQRCVSATGAVYPVSARSELMHVVAI